MKVRTALAIAAILCLAARACLLPEEIDAEKHIALHGALPKVAANFQANAQSGHVDYGVPIGTGDRFQNGMEAPRGLATEERDLKTILNPEEIVSGLKGLAKNYNGVKFFTAPQKTVESRTLDGIIIGNGEPRVYIEGGIHARERGGPDHILYFLSDLLHAREHGTGVTYAAKSYTKEQVLTALSAGIVTMPLVNPDGVAFDQETGSCWRKNRNRKSALTERDIGIDLNRNFDAVWDYKKYFAPSPYTHPASDRTFSESFHGTAPLSEVETQNIAWLLEQHANLSWFLDLHSTGGDILYSWGDDNSQSTDTEQSFKNPAYDGKRGVTGNDEPEGLKYKEYIDADDYQSQLAAAQRMSDAMNSVGEVQFTTKECAGLYASSGGSTDFMLSRYYGRNCGANRIQGLAIEFGNDSGLLCPFYPTNAQYHSSMRQVAVGLMELLLTAASPEGDLKTWKC
jgi:murein tripeptide amidase MpaA